MVLESRRDEAEIACSCLSEMGQSALLDFVSAFDIAFKGPNSPPSSVKV